MTYKKLSLVYSNDTLLPTFHVPAKKLAAITDYWHRYSCFFLQAHSHKYLADQSGHVHHFPAMWLTSRISVDGDSGLNRRPHVHNISLSPTGCQDSHGKRHTAPSHVGYDVTTPLWFSHSMPTVTVGPLLDDGLKWWSLNSESHEKAPTVYSESFMAPK